VTFPTFFKFRWLFRLKKRLKCSPSFVTSCWAESNLTQRCFGTICSSTNGVFSGTGTWVPWTEAELWKWRIPDTLKYLKNEIFTKLCGSNKIFWTKIWDFLEIIKILTFSRTYQHFISSQFFSEIMIFLWFSKNYFIFCSILGFQFFCNFPKTTKVCDFQEIFIFFHFQGYAWIRILQLWTGVTFLSGVATFSFSAHVAPKKSKVPKRYISKTIFSDYSELKNTKKNNILRNRKKVYFLSATSGRCLTRFVTENRDAIQV